jgi:tetratricopeptide (TPR) repeat protein
MRRQQLEPELTMKSTIVSLLIPIIALSSGLAGQSRTGSGAPVGSMPGNLPRAPDPRTNGPDTLPRVLYLTGKVVIDDGALLSERVLIQSNCEGTVRTEGYTDRKGAFSFEFSNTTNRMLSGIEMATDTHVSTSPGAMRQNTPRDWRKCELKGVSSGFTSQVVDLSTRPPAFGNVDIGSIVLHRLAPVEGLTISANAAQAPPEARKVYEKGREEKKNGNLDAAQENFRKALDAYPQYALAWLELGRVHMEKKDLAAARESFQQSIAADAKLMGPYQELAQLAARNQRWQEVADNTDQLLKLNSAIPEFWFYNCVSKYHLGDLDAAQYSALQGVRIDTEHRVPKMEYVLGTILAERHDYPGAAQHLLRYLSLLPDGPDAIDAQQKLDELERLH